MLYFKRSASDVCKILMESLVARGITCEKVSADSFRWDSALPLSDVQAIFDAFSVPLKVSLQKTESGSSGMVTLKGVSRVDE